MDQSKTVDGVMLAPKGAPKPSVFQRDHPMGENEFTSDPAAVVSE